jgi:hypothetical protein
MAENMLRKTALLATLASLAWASAALTVSVAPAEGKADAPPAGVSGSPLGYLVSGCLGVLFDAGFVVTDDAPFQGTRSAWAGIDFATAGAKEGQIDFVVALYVDWTVSGFHKDVLLPTAIAYKLVRVSDGKVIIEGDMAGSPDSEEASAHFAQTASQAGAKTALPCVKSLRTLAMGGEL